MLPPCSEKLAMVACRWRAGDAWHAKWQSLSKARAEPRASRGVRDLCACGREGDAALTAVNVPIPAPPAPKRYLTEPTHAPAPLTFT
jgi:hypothetical protein